MSFIFFPRLLINSTNPDLTGKYTCIVTNRGGNISREFQFEYGKLNRGYFLFLVCLKIKIYLTMNSKSGIFHKWHNNNTVFTYKMVMNNCKKTGKKE